MDGSLRLVLLAIALVVLAVMWFDTLFRKRRMNFIETQTEKEEYDFSEMDSWESPSESQQEPIFSDVSSAKTKPLENKYQRDLLVLSVMAKPGSHFASYDLLQAISAADLQFGDMNIFHYYDKSAFNQKIPLFSLASATPPGDFHMDKIGDFSCVGLMLFIQLSSVSNAKLAFDCMLKTAEQLADDLDGELRAGARTPWNEDMRQQYEEKVESFGAEAAELV